MPPLAELVGQSPGMMAVRKQIELLLSRRATGRRPPPILIEGETGTGKGLAARAIHHAGPRTNGPFVDVNCAAIPETVLEAELFGYERGAFTDARQSKSGLFQAANGGVIFLDEIGLLPLALQPKLLKVIEEQAVRRLGSTRSEPIDVLVISATNEALSAAVREGRFRADLYHRLSVLTLRLPPLRDRGRDVLLLAEHFLAHVCHDYGLPALSFGPEAREALQAYSWPGNARELSNVIERSALLAETSTVTAAMLALPASAPAPQRPTPDLEPSPVAPSLAGAPRDLEGDQVLEALTRANWNISRAAALLGVPRHTVRYRIEKYGLRAGMPAEREHTRHEQTAEAPPLPSIPSTLRWARRWITILRVGLVEPRTADVSPDSSRLIDTFIEKAQTFGGRVEDLSVTSLVAVFGLEPVEDAARRAALAAMAILKAAGRFRSSGGDDLAINITLHAGEFMVAQRGGVVQIDLDAKRHALTTLEALSQHTTPGTIVVTHATRSLLERRFEFVPLDRADRASVPAAQLTTYSPIRFGIAGHTADFVGRQHELEFLRSRFDSVLAGHGEVIGIAGEAGIGKSRLLFEFHQSLRTEKIRHLEMRCESYGRNIPYLPIIDLLRAYFRIDDRSDGMAIRERIAGSSSPLMALLDIPFEDPQWQSLAPPQRRQRTLEAITGWLIGESQVQPLLLLTVEDLQWVDRETEAVLEALVAGAPTCRLLLVATYRSEYRHRWQGTPGYSELRLGPLSQVSATEMLEDLLGPDPSLEPMKQLLIGRTDGNPFFLEETVRTLVENHALSGHPGAYRLTRQPISLTPPPTVRAVLAERIDRLPPARQRLLQWASVIGRSVPLQLLGAVSELGKDSLHEEVAALRASEFFDDARGMTDAACVFKHALTQEVTYESLLDVDRRLLHGKVLAAIEQLWPEARAEHAEVLAEHALRGEVWDKAVDYLRVAGAKAWSRGATEEAIGRYEAALASVSRLPAGHDTARRSIDVRLDLHAPLMTAGRTQEIAQLYPEAERRAREINDARRLGQVLQRMSQIAWLGGRYRVGADYAQQALAVAEPAGDAVTRLHAHYFLGLHRHGLGDYRGAIPCFSRLVEGPDAQIASSVISVTVPMDVPAWCWLAFASAMTGDFVRAEEALRRAIEIAEASDFPQARVIARTIEAIVLSYFGHADACLDTLQRAVELCERIGFFVWLAAASSTLGLVLTRVGRTTVALPYLERGVMINEKTGVKTYHAQRHAWWAEGLLRAGDVDGARTHAEAAVELSSAMEERGIEAEALLVRALVAQAQAADGEARQWFERAMTASSTTGARPLEAHCHLGLGELLRRIGETGEARHHLETADAMFREMRLRRWWPERYVPG